MTDLSSMIEASVAGPKSVSVDGTEVDAQSIDDLVKAEQHLAAKDGAASTRHPGIRFAKLTRPVTTV